MNIIISVGKSVTLHVLVYFLNCDTHTLLWPTFFHSKISWLSFHVNEHISLFHSIAQQAAFACGIHTPFLCPTLPQTWVLPASYIPYGAITNHSQQDPGRTSHPNWPRLLSLSRNLESRPGESWGSLEMVPGKFWHCVVVIFCHVEQDTPVCEEEKKAIRRDADHPGSGVLWVPISVSIWLHPTTVCGTPLYPLISLLYYLIHLKYINSGNQKIPSNHYS